LFDQKNKHQNRLFAQNEIFIVFACSTGRRCFYPKLKPKNQPNLTKLQQNILNFLQI